MEPQPCTGEPELYFKKDLILSAHSQKADKSKWSAFILLLMFPLFLKWNISYNRHLNNALFSKEYILIKELGPFVFSIDWFIIKSLKIGGKKVRPTTKNPKYSVYYQIRQRKW